MLSIEDVYKENDDNFTKTATKYADILRQVKPASEIQYKLGQIALLQEAKRILEKEEQFKYIPFTDIVHQLQTYIGQSSREGEASKKGELNLSGIKIKQRKKRVFRERNSDYEDDSSKEIAPSLHKTKLDGTLLNPGAPQ